MAGQALAGIWPFVGRKRELARVRAALAAAETAGLLVAGPAGGSASPG